MYFNQFCTLTCLVYTKNYTTTYILLRYMYIFYMRKSEF